jgi:hypothetical protein
VNEPEWSLVQADMDDIHSIQARQQIGPPMEPECKKSSCGRSLTDARGVPGVSSYRCDEDLWQRNWQNPECLVPMRKCWRNGEPGCGPAST